jgi:hypothetical protein
MARKKFAVIDVADDCLHTMEAAEAAVDLEGRYPPGIFLIVDMDGKDDVPFKVGAFMQDLTIDMATGEWIWKLNDVEIADRAKAQRHTLLRNRLLTLLVAREMSVTQGPEFGPITLSLEDQIGAIQAEIAPM